MAVPLLGGAGMCGVELVWRKVISSALYMLNLPVG